MKLTTTHTASPISGNIKPKLARGFASLITVISVATGLMLILMVMYRSTIDSQQSQKYNLLRNDYQQREDAFLRALTNIVPNRAMQGMQDNSWPYDTRRHIRWHAIFDEALEQANAKQAVSSATATELGINTFRSGNVGNNEATWSTTVKPALNSGYSQFVSSGCGRAASTSYPPPLSADHWICVRDCWYPVISLRKKYSSSATGWVQDDVVKYPHYNRVKAPKLHFNYHNDSHLIAKHNWWAFKLSLAGKDKDKTKISRREKVYAISIYEIPSQLPINSASFTTLGTHNDGTEWSNISIAGGVFAEKIKTEGTFSVDALSSRQGVELSAGTTVNGNVTGSATGSNPFASSARELAQSKGNVFPISSSSDGGRVSFIPINRGLDFYDRFVGGGDTPSSSNAVSPTSWDYYSIGAKQCAMRLDIKDVVSATNQMPTEIEFSYWADIPNDGLGGYMITETFRVGQNWPGPNSNNGRNFPFHRVRSASGHPSLMVHMDRLVTFLTARHGGDFNINHSISINPDYVNNPSIAKPSFPMLSTDLAVIIEDAKDLTDFTRGFSMVTNMQLIIADDLNVTPTSPPAGMSMAAGEQFYPPLSLFAPEKRYGNSISAVRIDIEGQLGSLAKNTATPVRIADFKSGRSEKIIPENITATLKSVKHPAALPPINLINWMCVVREIHPRFIPQPSQGTNGGGN